MATTTGTQTGLRISTALLFLSLCLPYLCIATDIYRPDDFYSISCGSSSDFPADSRNWTADTNTKFLLETQNNNNASSSVAAEPIIKTTDPGPYTSARLSYSEFTYSFPVTTSGQKFIRLFFYPTSYHQDFDSTKAYFSVKSGEYTLLNDFYPSPLYAGSDDDPVFSTFFKEYCVYVKDGDHTLNVTFTPSTPINRTDRYYAFINAIEVVSMPPYVYHTNHSGAGMPQIVVAGNYGENPYPLENNSALETKYRLKVGATEIPPLRDTGMMRHWYGDEKFLFSHSGQAGQYKEPTTLNYSLVSQYTAPEELYHNLRHMGNNETMNLNFKLTWNLLVDSGFQYMLRLHFCELDHITKPGDRIFSIYIQGLMAEDKADVLHWTDGQRATPIFKDYVVMVPSSGNQKYTNISLQMSPLPASRYIDAVLNGLELFKINNSRGNLAGPNLEPLPETPPTPQQAPLHNKTSSSKTLAAVVGAVSSVSLLCFLVAMFFIKRQKKKKKSHRDYNNASKHKSEGPLSKLPTNLCRHFSIEEIRAATNNFDELFVVGVGGFGNVYRGYIDDAATPVAIKRLKPGSQQGAHEFLNEIEMLSQLRHLHLVSLIGYCYESNEMILVYDFMTRGTLRDHLYNTDDPLLSWKQRLSVCIGAARGLHYLHTGAKHMIIHRDVKSTNILLDEKWIAKVSDFGLSRVGPSGTSMTHVSTVVKGSVGYLDPEYYKRQRLTDKSDVYSFGVVLLEVLCGRPPLLRNVEKRHVSLVDWARRCYHEGTLGEIVDPTMKGEIAPECLRTFGELAMKCLLDEGTQRPSMNDVVGGLEFVLQLQENSAAVVVVVKDSDEMFSSSTSSRNASDNSKSSGMSITTSSGDHSSSTFGISKESQRLLYDNVFSEIADPKGR